MEDQAKFGLFLSNDVCRQQRGLLCPGNQITSFKGELFSIYNTSVTELSDLS